MHSEIHIWQVLSNALKKNTSWKIITNIGFLGPDRPIYGLYPSLKSPWTSKPCTFFYLQALYTGSIPYFTIIARGRLHFMWQDKTFLYIFVKADRLKLSNKF